MVNWDKIHAPDGTTISSYITKFKITGYRDIEDLFIEIWQYNSPNPYVGICSYHFWGPEQLDPYLSTHGGTSVESAFSDSLGGIIHFDREEYDNDVVFFVKYHGKKEIIYDGNGEIVSRDEALKRRAKYYEHQKK